MGEFLFSPVSPSFSSKGSGEGFWGKLQLILVGLNIVGTLIAALLFTFAPAIFERPAHYCEYAVQVTITSANYIFIFNAPKKKGQRHRGIAFWAQLALNTLLVGMAIVKILFYVSVIPADMGPVSCLC